MNYFKHSFGILSLVCAGTLLMPGVYAKKAGKSASKISSSDSSGKMNKSDLEEEKKQLAMYPFTKGSVSAENVVGVKTGVDEVTLFSSENKYSTQKEQKDITFDSVTFFSKYPNLQSIELSGIELTEEKLENLQKFIPSKIKGLSICNCEVSEDKISRLEDIINLRKNLMSFSLSFPDCNSEKSTRFLGAMKACKDMKFLNFTFGCVNGNGIKMISELVKSSGSTLKGLTLGIGHIEEDEKDEGLLALLDAIQELANLERLEISFIELPEAASGKLFAVLGKLKKLKSLRLFFGNHRDYNQMKLFENLEVCRDAIAQMKQLENLDISSMKLPESYMHLFGQAVEFLPELKTLNISDNKIDEKGAEIFANSFKSAGRLEVLTAKNCNIDAQTFAVFCKNLGNTSLRQADFSSNLIGEGIKSISLGATPDLVVIDFSNNGATYENIIEFLKTLKAPIGLKCVNFSDKNLLEISPVERILRHDEIEQWKLKSSAPIALLGT